MTVKNANSDSPTQVGIKPTPKSKPLMKAKFTELVALNFSVDPSILEPRLPKGVELHFYGNETYVSLVAMMLRNVRVYNVPITIAKMVGEFNLRFYVRRKVGENQYKNGSCFIKDYVSSWAASWALEKLFKAEFGRIRMKWAHARFDGDEEGRPPSADYRWQVDGDRWNRIRVLARERVAKTGRDTKVGFILNHSFIYSKRGNKTLEYPVTRPAWSIWNAGQANFTCDVERLFGPEFVKPLAKRPASVFVANGSEVVVYRPNILT